MATECLTVSLIEVCRTSNRSLSILLRRASFKTHFLQALVPQSFSFTQWVDVRAL